MQFKNQIITAALMGLVSIGSWNVADADDKHKSRGKHKHRSSQKNHRGHGGFSGISIGPGGVGFSFQNEDFGIDIAPGTLRNLRHGINGGQQYHNHNHFVQPILPQAILPPPMPVDPIVPVFDPYARRPIPSMPIAPQPNYESQTIISTNLGARQFQRVAEQAFIAGDYATAMKAIGHSTLEDPQNGKIHLLASQIAFAVGNYETSTSALVAATDLLPADQWYFVMKHYRQFYRDRSYVDQMSRLDEFAEQNPKHAYAQSLRAFHFFGLGHQDEALKLAQDAIAIDKSDILAKRMIQTQSSSTTHQNVVIANSHVMAPEPGVPVQPTSTSGVGSSSSEMFSVLQE